MDITPQRISVNLEAAIQASVTTTVLNEIVDYSLIDWFSNGILVDIVDTNTATLLEDTITHNLSHYLTYGNFLITEKEQDDITNE